MGSARNDDPNEWLAPGCGRTDSVEELYGALRDRDGASPPRRFGFGSIRVGKSTYQVQWFFLKNALVRGSLLDAETRSHTFESLQAVERAISRDKEMSEKENRPLCGYCVFEVTD